MLKRLEIVGFKSFADKTQFDFPSGITGIVGPNGSGKSNVVDAVRWVMGEQSAKSLRGGEMTDVIFNGSASRRSLGMAEVTLIFDNRKHTLATEADEVHITRRVYRSGEGEYLINQQICRLKDIKDLFLGSGAGTDAYSIIEQGRVDVMLQASTKERRTIFEEAAGISRFKAKKIETLRRLERVDQNLQRLKDILDEVEKQLRSVKLQAAKAQRYQEYSIRLKDLRVGLSLQEYHKLSKDLSSQTSELELMRANLQDQILRSDDWEQKLKTIEENLQQLEQSIRSRESELGQSRQEIAAEVTRQSHEWSLTSDLEQVLKNSQQELALAARQLTSLEQASALAVQEFSLAEKHCNEQRREVQDRVTNLQKVEVRIASLQEQLEIDKKAHMDAMRLAARLQNDVVSYKSQMDNLIREKERLRLRSEQAEVNLASLTVQLEELTAGEENLQNRLNAARQALADTRRDRDRYRNLAEETNRKVSDLRTELSALNGRVEILEGLELSHEGLGTGPRELLDLLKQPDPGPWSTVIGIVADYLTVRREYAPLIDLALGERAQRFLVRDARQLGQALQQLPQPFSGRVSFLPIEDSVSDPSSPAIGNQSLNPSSAVIGLAENVVRCEDPMLAALPGRLLRRTVIVRDMETARQLKSELEGFRFITLQGELLDEDGTLTVGTHHAEGGILSRKSELRELREQIQEIQVRRVELEQHLLVLRDQVTNLDNKLESRQIEIEVLTEQVADLRSRLGQQKERREGLHEEVEVSRSEITNLEQDLGRMQLAWERSRDQQVEAESLVQQLQARQLESDQELRGLNDQRHVDQQQTTTAQVSLAQAEERLSSLQTRQEQCRIDLQRCLDEQTQQRVRQNQTRDRLLETEKNLLSLSSRLADHYRIKEQAERNLAELIHQTDSLRQERRHLLEQTQTVRAAYREQQEQLHARELRVAELRHQAEGLCVRLHEDYQLNLADIYERKRTEFPEEADADHSFATLLDEGEPVAEGETAEHLSPADEIVELRRKLNRLGSVNLEAIEELKDLEIRHDTLQVQYDDLTAAQQQLQDIIGRINNDSRRLFTETFSTIRSNFQELFRKLFGGGMADIVLEDEVDILESGIEVIARPPGKELRSISLMSGGEKTMTAVALLLAIFRSRPSPFCILDEVDAALDEANVGRFTAVLRDYLDRSQFIIITHSKRTMQCADVLYGVTMQESGISRRMSIRFEDWKDEEPQPAA